jgi:galactose mutarotase-like enzyme
MADQPRTRVALHSSELAVEIDTHGAQLFTLRDRGARDLLWDGDPAVWSGRAPLLFPIVGVLVNGSYRCGSKTYRLPRHGFAPYLGIWTKPGARFICIEPWHGVTDRQGFSGDFREKEGVFVLPCGDTFTTTVATTIMR